MAGDTENVFKILVGEYYKQVPDAFHFVPSFETV